MPNEFKHTEFRHKPKLREEEPVPPMIPATELTEDQKDLLFHRVLLSEKSDCEGVGIFIRKIFWTKNQHGNFLEKFVMDTTEPFWVVR